jgi:outer membrane protein assembly factor BamB
MAPASLARRMLLVLACLSIVGPTAAADSPPAADYQLNPAHTGATHFDSLPRFPLARIWSVDLPGTLSFPLIVGDRVYVSCQSLSGGTAVYALDATSGAVVWGPVSTGGYDGMLGLPAYDADKLFVLGSLVDSGGRLTALDAQSGAELWRCALPNEFYFESAPTATQGMVYAAGSENDAMVYAVNASSGALAWSQGLMGGDHSSPAVSGTKVYVSFPCQVYALSKKNGSPKWHFSGPCYGPGGATPVLANGKLYTLDWTADPAGTVFDAQTGKFVSHFYSDLVTPAIGATRAYVVNGGVLQGLKLGSLATQWSFIGDGSLGRLGSSPIVINDKVVILLGGSGRIFAVNAKTGEPLWDDRVSDPGSFNTTSSVAAAQGLVVAQFGSHLAAYK